MSYQYFSLRNIERGGLRSVNINSEAVVCYYANPMAEESVIVELSNGSKFDLKTGLSEVDKWLEAGC